MSPGVKECFRKNQLPVGFLLASCDSSHCLESFFFLSFVCQRRVGHIILSTVHKKYLHARRHPYANRGALTLPLRLGQSCSISLISIWYRSPGKNLVSQIFHLCDPAFLQLVVSCRILYMCQLFRRLVESFTIWTYFFPDNVQGGVYPSPSGSTWSTVQHFKRSRRILPKTYISQRICTRLS